MNIKIGVDKKRLSSKIEIAYPDVASITGADGSRQPSTKELAMARFQGKHVATIAAKLKK